MEILHCVLVSITHELDVLIEDLGVKHRHVKNVGTFDLLGGTIIVIVHGAYKNLDHVNVQPLICDHQVQAQALR